jgi:malonyl-CoA/methylmalonyl-CoA synthetase
VQSELIDGLRDVVAARGDQVAVENDAETLTYGALWQRARVIAGELSRRGLAGERVGLLAEPGPLWVEAFVGCLLAGTTAVALTELYAEQELSSLIRASRARSILASDSLLHLASRVAGSSSVVGIRVLASGRGAGAPVAPLAKASAPALLLFTSGTTGRPKGVPITHASVLHLGRTLAAAWRFTSDDTLLHVLPLHHLHGIGVSLVVALLSGARVRFLPRFDAARVWDELAFATAVMGVPTQHKKLFDAFDGAPADRRAAWSDAAGRLRLLTSGSAALPAVLGERWRSLAGQYPLERYGMTEIGIVLSNPVAGDRRPGSVGVPLPGVELCITDEHGEPVRENEPGELRVRAPTVFEGYDGDEGAQGATAAAFSDGWFLTGDTARQGTDGYVTILGRTSVDILKSGGEKLSALEIEDALREHPDLADVAVVGVPDETWGDAVVAVVVPRDGRAEAVTEASLRAWAKARLTGYKVPKRVVVVEELPRNPLGKVVKGELVRRLRGAE